MYKVITVVIIMFAAIKLKVVVILLFSVYFIIMAIAKI